MAVAVQLGLPDWIRELDDDELARCKLEWPKADFVFVVTKETFITFRARPSSKTLTVTIPVGFLFDGVSHGIPKISNNLNLANAAAHDFMYAGGMAVDARGQRYRPTRGDADCVLSLPHREILVRVFARQAWRDSHARGVCKLADADTAADLADDDATPDPDDAAADDDDDDSASQELID